MSAEATFPLTSNRDREVRAEQVQLVFRSMRNSLLLGSILALILTLVLLDESNRTMLLGWLAAVVTSRVLCVSYASFALSRGVTPANSCRHITAMSCLKVLEGLAWGALAWIIMGEASLAAQLLTMASLAGVSSNAVSLLAPVFPIYISMQLAHMTSLNSKLLMLEEPSFTVLAVGCSLFVIGQAGQALLAQQASRQSMLLRFENLELVEQLQLATERAEQARIKAEEANLAKSRFLAAASHDLRQPVHAQELFLEVLSQSELTELQEKVLNSARAASQASAQMLNTLLDFSRIEAGVVEPQPCDFPLQPLLCKLENELGSQADSKGIVYRCRETQLHVNSDPNLLELMLRNLISNAIRYTHQGGLLIGCRRRGGEVTIEVFDTGIGIEPAQQREIFREFHQLGNPERDRLKGLGLGLAITEGLAQSLGHGLTVTSRPGRGSVFRIRLPLAHAGAGRDVFELPEGPRLEEGLLTGLRVLVIEDDTMARQGMAQLLGSWGCDCQAVEHTSDALELVSSWPAELLISDYRLRENQTGAQAISRIREALGMQIPALIITGDTAPKRLREAHRSGVRLLHKPVTPNQLYGVLVKILEPGRG